MRSLMSKVVLIGLACGSMFVAGQSAARAAAPASGYNDWACKPSAAHPDPVVLLHGLGATYDEDLGQQVAPYLAGAGYCVYGETYGATSVFGSYVGGVGDIPASGRQIGAFVDRVLASTHATRVDLVGHSEGAFMSLWVPKITGYARWVRRVVAIAPPTHGTTFAGLVTAGQTLGLMPQFTRAAGTSGCPACGELVVGGSAVKTLDSGPIAQRGITYTIIASRSDELVTPTSTSFAPEPGVHNTYIQGTCPSDPVGHIGEAYDSDVEQMISNALDPATARTVSCSYGLPF